ncbi:MAG: RNA 2',3'-cyclic phosphodiesterase [Thermodesulfobacteriota bacterium]
MEIRSFLAFEQPPEIRAILDRVSGELRRSRLDVRWVKPENIHLTIVFLGNIRSEYVEAMEDPLRKLCLTTGPFQISLKGAGCFPNSRRPRVLWIGLEGDLERMGRFRDFLQDEMQPFGARREDRAFRAHLTLGRFRSPERADRELDEILARYRDLTSPVCPLKELILFKSELRPGGSVYTRLKSWPLAGSD